MACQSPQRVWANFKKRAKCLYSLRYWPSERRGNLLKELRPERLASHTNYTTLTSPSKPEAASRHAGLVRGKCLHEQVRIFDMHPLTGPEHFECRIEAKKRLQQVLLIPESMPIKHPLLRIFQGQKDVVHVHNDSWPDARQNLQ